MNTDYKYQLAKRGKAICPACERKTFVFYIDNSTGNPLHSTVGKCDRADNCGHHYSPKQYFTDNPVSIDTLKNCPPYRKTIPKPQPVPSYIDVDIFKKSLQGYENNALVQYLCGIVGDEATKEAIERYYIGTAKNGGTIFWQVDAAGKIRTGKVIQYAADGHRRKDVMPPVSWVHTILKLPDFFLMQCLFGEHLLRDAAKMVAIVESEKTAIIASVYLPQFIWLACGGSEGLNIDKCRCLKGRDVVLYPDIKQFSKWNGKAKELRKICRTVNVSDLLEKAATESERAAGLDLADYLVRLPLSDFTKPQSQPQQPHCLLQGSNETLYPYEQVQEQPQQEQPASEPQQAAQSKQYQAYVSEAGVLYIPTPPDRHITHTVYPNVEVYNKRSEQPTFVPEQSVDISTMKQIFINLNTLTI
jgi:hypothetical protein